MACEKLTGAWANGDDLLDPIVVNHAVQPRHERGWIGGWGTDKCTMGVRRQARGRDSTFAGDEHLVSATELADNAEGVLVCAVSNQKSHAKRPRGRLLIIYRCVI
jgi:hypothetical protein